LTLPGRFEPDGEQTGMLARRVRRAARDPEAQGGGTLLAQRVHRGQEEALGAVPATASAPLSNDAVEVSAYLRVEQAGEYWFRVDPPVATCVAVDGLPMVSGSAMSLDWDVGHAFLRPGLHRVTITRGGAGLRRGVRLLWRPAGGGRYEVVPDDRFVVPRLVATDSEGRP
jgi:hypothetical protein